jgi:hypothetical protein
LEDDVLVLIIAGVMAAGTPAAYTAPEAAPTEAPTATLQPSPTESVIASTGRTVSGRVSGDKVVLSWDKDTSPNFSGYKVVASRTNPTPSYPADGYLKYITNANTTSFSLYEGYGGLRGGVSYYFSITYLYQDGSTVAGNAVRLKVPNKDDGAEPTEGPTEEPSGSYTSTNISGSVGDDGKIHLSWSRISRDTYSGFEGYKVMYSFTDSTPVYGEDGCDYVYWIEDDSTTSCSFYPSKIGASSGQTVYFSITALYDGHSVRKAGDTVTLVMPESVPEEPYASTNVSGSISGTTANISWNRITDERCEGYKIMYSFIDSNPVYNDGDNNEYIYISDLNVTSYSFDVSGADGYAPGATCYISISALYEGHSVVKPGNVITGTVS